MYYFALDLEITRAARSTCTRLCAYIYAHKRAFDQANTFGACVRVCAWLTCVIQRMNVAREMRYTWRLRRTLHSPVLAKVLNRRNDSLHVYTCMHKNSAFQIIFLIFNEAALHKVHILLYKCAVMCL